MKVIIILLMFLFLGALLIVSNNNLKFSSSEETNVFFNLWLGWFENLFGNLKSVTGYVIGQNWMP
jgi:hypothetical protein